MMCPSAGSRAPRVLSLAAEFAASSTRSGRFERRGWPVKQPRADHCDMQGERIHRVRGVLAGQLCDAGEAVRNGPHRQMKLPGCRGCHLASREVRLEGCEQGLGATL